MKRAPLTSAQFLLNPAQSEPGSGEQTGNATPAVWALALAAERVLSRRVAAVTSIRRRSKKGVA